MRRCDGSLIRSSGRVATDSIAAHSDTYSSRLSATSRTARSRSSCGYLCDRRAIGLHPHGPNWDAPGLVESGCG